MVFVQLVPYTTWTMSTVQTHDNARIFWSVRLHFWVRKQKRNCPDQTQLFYVFYAMFSSSLHLIWAKKDFSVPYFPFPGKIYQLKVSDRNTRKRCEICSKLTTKTPLVSILSYLFLGFLLLTLNRYLIAGYPYLIKRFMS